MLGLQRNFLLFSLISTLSLTAAQTFTSCNPLHKKCPSDPALGTNFNQTYRSNSELNTDYWKQTGSPSVKFNGHGMDFNIRAHGDAPTIQTQFYIFFGKVEVIMKAAAGQGIISSIVLLSDDLDEIDWEIMGGNSTAVETNYYGKGNTSEINSLYYPCDNPEGSFHNYTTVWTPHQLQWYLDGKAVRTLKYAHAKVGGKTTYPQTPSRLKLGSWPGGDPSEPKGTRQWAGGMVDYSEGPFRMTVKSVKIEDHTRNATEYIYGNESGNYQSIDVKKGTSSASQKIHAPPPKSPIQEFNSLSTGTKIAIICVIAGVFIVAFGVLAFCCVKQRRIGRREKAAADAAWDKDVKELAEYKEMMASGKFGDGNKRVISTLYVREV